MSTELFEVLSLAARYLFALFSMLIVLRAVMGLLSEQSDRQQRLHRLPNSGMIGELVVLSGGRELREGDVIAVPWEGTLGSVRSADICVPCKGISRKHLYFSYEHGRGLLVHPRSGCEAIVNGIPLNCHSRPEENPLTHGAFLQVGQAMLRLRVFAGLDSTAGFADTVPNAPIPSQIPSPLPSSVMPSQPEPYYASVPAAYPSQPEDIYPVPAAAEFAPDANIIPPSPVVRNSDPSWEGDISSPTIPLETSESLNPIDSTSPSRSRRSDRWEVDWSE